MNMSHFIQVKHSGWYFCSPATCLIKETAWWSTLQEPWRLKEDACLFLHIPASRLLQYQDVREDILWIERWKIVFSSNQEETKKQEGFECWIKMRRPPHSLSAVPPLQSGGIISQVELYKIESTWCFKSTVSAWSSRHCGFERSMLQLFLIWLTKRINCFAVFCSYRAEKQRNNTSCRVSVTK